MSVEITLNTPLADALTGVIQPKLMEVGWAQSNDDAALSEYIILMLVNGKTQEQIASELAGDLLSLGPDDPAARDFAHWLFDQINALQSQLNGGTVQLGHTAGGVSSSDVMPMEQDTEMSTPTTDSPEFNAPTGPKSMRNGNMRGGREKRMFGQMAKAMDRTHDSMLHRVRANGNERINAHNRGPPTGPRGGRGNNRMMNNRTAAITAGLNQMAGGMPNMPGPPPGMNGMNDMSWMMQGGGQQEQLFHLLQQQNLVMAQLQQQLAQQSPPVNDRHSRSLFDRVQNPRGGRRGGHHVNGSRSQQNGSPRPTDTNTEGDDVDMSQARADPPNPEITICKYNLACTNKDCKFAHQSPAAPPNTTIDVNDVCSFGVACKNWKCVGRHPSPATKRAHQNEQECKFYPNCTNPHCPFKHPDMPPCRNGGDCNVEGCKFAHVQTMCKFKPCKNRYCHFKHEEGQRGTFPDKVWTADGAQNHVSERQFVDKNGMEELIIPGADEDGAQDAAAMDASIQ
ncbi:putative nuclear polyadenylated RNA-binding protein Nab2 [Rosellinia necatrix]|uniref:Putative nuclear polyadenylated RNA-binding protein Nab2 n=1 Tax=Rosellinia necatrix TaxID=77044 RepID=A0A1S7UJJ4_ROSNE|nr:putative nuclear polyadenylated RNA-binding protein Nab2 [Rosellinia necatrix]